MTRHLFIYHGNLITFYDYQASWQVPLYFGNFPSCLANYLFPLVFWELSQMSSNLGKFHGNLGNFPNSQEIWVIWELSQITQIPMEI